MRCAAQFGKEKITGHRVNGYHYDHVLKGDGESKEVKIL